MASRWVDEPVRLLTLVQSLVPVAEIAVVGLVLLAALLRQKVVSVVGLVPALVAGWLFVTPWVPHTVEPADGDLVVLSTNLQFGGAETSQVIGAVRQHAADVVVLVEITPEGLTRLDAAGLETLLPYAVGSPDTAASGTIIRSRWPMVQLSSGEGATGLQLGFRQPVARVERPGRPFVVKAVHPLPPTGWVRTWHADLGLLDTWADGVDPSLPLVLAGDFNATADHPAYRRLARGFSDATRDAGAGWLRTWPRDAPVPALVQLDHVLVRGMRTVDAGDVLIDHTDHAAVWARLQ